MTTPQKLPERLERLGDALHAATAADLATARAAGRARRRRRTIGAVVAVAIVAPGAALAANALISTDEVERSLPNGTLALLGTEPRCTEVRAGVEYACVLSRPPREGDIAAGQWKGAGEPTVDDAKRVNGGCRSLNAEGTRWRCYIGREAVRQKIIGPDFLGEYAPVPGVG